MMLKLIGCKVFMRELYLVCAHSKHVVDIIWMDVKLHENPANLKAALQKKIDEIENNENEACDGILLGFGLCSMGIVGLKTRRYPLIVPRAHDCITVLLGSSERYRELFDEYDGGIYWYSPGWIEQMKTPGRNNDEKSKYLMYVEKYGEDNAQYLMEVEGTWTENYTCAALIRWPEFSENILYETATRAAAEKNKLSYTEFEGRSTMLSKLVNGEWDEDFLILNPGQRLAYSGDERIICAAPTAEEHV